MLARKADGSGNAQDETQDTFLTAAQVPTTPAVYATSVPFGRELTANATVPGFDVHGGVYLKFIGVPGRVVVSRGAEAALVVESAWSHENDLDAKVTYVTAEDTFVTVNVGIVCGRWGQLN